jgi:N-acetylmuramoyl-L-alanine amidase
VTLAVARRLKAAIEGRLGVRVLLTRDGDQAVAADQRAALANNNKADLFVSLHANASFRPTVSGATVYVAAFPENARSDRSAPPERLPAFGGGFRDLELVPWNLAQMRHKDQSEALANLILEQFKDKVPVGPQGLDHVPLRVLEPANMPAVLIELGYLTNAEQEKKLGDSEFQGAVAQSVLEAIIRFRDVGAQTEGGVR